MERPNGGQPDPLEIAAVRSLIGRIRQPGMPPLFAAVLFGSKARGDADARSDIDVLIVCDVPAGSRARAARAVNAAARQVSRARGVRLHPWTVTRGELRRGRRTPMLVDALADGIPLWPPDLRDVRLPFTRDDAVFCVVCLLDWWREGGRLVRRAIAEGDCELAAARTRDDITRLATAALLLLGETRHRRCDSLLRFRTSFIATGIISPEADKALRWAELAYPRGDWRGPARPPPSRFAARTAEQGVVAARAMEAAILPWLQRRQRRLASGAPA